MRGATATGSKICYSFPSSNPTTVNGRHQSAVTRHFGSEQGLTSTIERAGASKI